MFYYGKRSFDSIKRRERGRESERDRERERERRRVTEGKKGANRYRKKKGDKKWNNGI